MDCLLELSQKRRKPHLERFHSNYQQEPLHQSSIYSILYQKFQIHDHLKYPEVVTRKSYDDMRSFLFIDNVLAKPSNTQYRFPFKTSVDIRLDSSISLSKYSTKKPSSEFEKSLSSNLGKYLFVFAPFA